MKDHQIRAWLRIVDTGGIRAAARSLHLTQAAVTKAIRDLEEELDAPLLIRSTRGTSVTEFGVRITPRLRLAQQQLDIAKQDVLQLRGGDQARVGVAVMPLIFLTVLPEVLSQFRQLMPLGKVSIIEGLMNSVVPSIRDGTVDFAIGAAYPESLPSDLVLEPWSQLEMMIAARPDHQHAGAISWDEICKNEWLVHPAANSPSSQFLQWIGAQGLPVPDRRLEVDTFGVAWSLVSRGNALLLCPRAMIEIPSYGKQVVRIPLQLTIPKLTLGVIKLRDAPLSYAAGKLSELFLAAAAKESWLLPSSDTELK